MRNHPLGIYEKALMKDPSARAVGAGKSCGFDFVEMSRMKRMNARARMTSAQRAHLW